LVAATIDGIRMHGFDALTSRDIAAAAGVSTGLLHHYFPSMAAALEAAFEHAAQEDLNRLVAAIGGDPDAVHRLDRLISLYIPAEGDGLWELWFDAFAASSRHPSIRATTARLTSVWAEMLEQILAEGVAEGTFDCSDTSASAWRLTALLDGLAVETVALRTISRARARELVEAAVAHEVGSRVWSGSLHSPRKSALRNDGRSPRKPAVRNNGRRLRNAT
jgi:AcrR family transcriptional regulator